MSVTNKLAINRLMALATGHMMINLLDVMGPVLLVFVSRSMRLGNAQIGLISGAFMLVAALCQPVFGWLADRRPAAWLAPGGLAWQIVFFSLAILAGAGGSFPLLLATYTLAAVGLGAFYPQGIVLANRCRGAGLYLAFGYLGLSVGPALAGVTFARLGPAYLLLAVVVLGLPACAWLALSLRGGERGDPVTPSPPHAVEGGTSAIIGLFAIQGLRMWADFGAMVFAIRLFQEKGWSPELYGGLAALWLVGEAIFVAAGGPMSACWGRTVVLTASLLIGAGLLVAMPLAGGPAAFAMALAAGGALSVAAGDVVLVQGVLPRSQALASGAALAIVTASGGVSVMLNGYLADLVGLPATIQLMALPALLAAACVWPTRARPAAGK
jgi:FSR family fosmidomycin resistance protein-like MFS transporter